MPLVVPGISGNPGDKTEAWTNKLVGKKLGDEPSNETVCSLGRDSGPGADLCRQTFAKTDLPKETRVVEPGMMVTKDHNPERLNVHLKEDGTVSHVSHG